MEKNKEVQKEIENNINVIVVEKEICPICFEGILIDGICPICTSKLNSHK